MFAKDEWLQVGKKITSKPEVHVIIYFMSVFLFFIRGICQESRSHWAKVDSTIFDFSFRQTRAIEHIKHTKGE